MDAVARVRVRGAHVRYGERDALHQVSLEARAGELVALAGPNGSGKTTLLRAILGLVPLADGSVELGGDPLAHLSIRERARRVAWVPQEEGLQENVPLRDYVLYGRYPYLGLFEPEGAAEIAAAEEALSSVGLGDRLHEGILEISGGERQRAVLARALAQSTPLLLLDEPTAHLDVGHQLDLLERVRRRAAERGVAVIAAIHDLNLAARFADRVLVLSEGRAVASGPPAEVLSESLIQRVWGVTAELRVDARTGVRYLVPYVRRPADAGQPDRIGPVHVVGGGGAASPILRALHEAGYLVTCGALHLLDTDSETAQALSVPAVLEVPFAPLGEEVREKNRRWMREAGAIVVAPFAVGPSNLGNLEDVEAVVPDRPCFVLDPGDASARDFTGGRATRSLERIVARGARRVASLAELVDELGRQRAVPVPTGPPAGRPIPQ